jgi:hypothetical protein
MGCTPQERKNRTLSEQLDRSHGVICPPDVDPGMTVPTPRGVPTSPPGSPGGDPNVDPK